MWKSLSRSPWIRGFSPTRRCVGNKWLCLCTTKAPPMCACVCVRVRAYVQLFNDNMNMCMYSPVVSYISCACAIPCAGWPLLISYLLVEILNVCTTFFWCKSNFTHLATHKTEHHKLAARCCIMFHLEFASWRNISHGPIVSPLGILKSCEGNLQT